MSRALDNLKMVVAAGQARVGWTEIKHVLLGKGDGLGTFVKNADSREVWCHRRDSADLFTIYLPPMAPFILRDGDPTIERIEVRIGKPPGLTRYELLDAGTPAGVAAVGRTSPIEAEIWRGVWSGLSGQRDLIDSNVTISLNYQMTFSRRITVTAQMTIAGLLSIVA